MADDTTLNAGTGGSVMRDIDRSGVHTVVVQPDIGGASAEKLWTAGANTTANSAPVNIASDQAYPRNSALAVAITALDVAGSTPSANGVAATATANSTAFLLLRGGENAVRFQITGTPVGVTNNLQFEFSPDATSASTGLWYPLFLRRTGGGPGSTGEAPAAVTQFNGVYDGAAPLAAAVRLRLQGAGSSGGTFTVNVYSGFALPDGNASLAAGVATTTLGAVGISQATPGVSNAVQDLNNPADVMNTGVVTTTVGNNILLNVVAGPATTASDTGSARSAFIQVTPTSGTVTAGAYVFEESNDSSASTWQPAMVEDMAAPGVIVGTITAAASTPRFFGVSLRMRYLRCRISTGVTGTTTGLIALTYFRSAPYKSAQAVLGTTTLADALANAAFPVTGDMALLFNNSTWDRQRSNYNTTTGDTGAKTSTFAGAAQTNFNARGALITLVLGAVTGTTPTMTAQVQMSPDGGTTWVNLTGAVTASLNAANASTSISVLVYPGVAAVANAAVSAALPRTWRINYTIGGTSPSFTITSVLVAYMN